MITESLNSEPLWDLTNVRGRNIKTDVVNFSFYFFSKAAVGYSIRVEIVWNRDRMSCRDDANSGVLELNGKYEYKGCRVDESDLQAARSFFMKYKVLFSAVWERVLMPDSVNHYLTGYHDFEEVIRELELVSATKSDEILQEFRQLKKDGSYANYPDDERNLKIFEDIVRRENLYDMND